MHGRELLQAVQQAEYIMEQLPERPFSGTPLVQGC
jgi:hypothetical protein